MKMSQQDINNLPVDSNQLRNVPCCTDVSQIRYFPPQTYLYPDSKVSKNSLIDHSCYMTEQNLNGCTILANSRFKNSTIRKCHITGFCDFLSCHIYPGNTFTYESYFQDCKLIGRNSAFTPLNSPGLSLYGIYRIWHTTDGLVIDNGDTFFLASELGFFSHERKMLKAAGYSIWI